jgi:hypothetical protein
MPDVRLIDANALVKEIESVHCKGCNNYNGAMCRACEWMDAMDYIEDAPTIDAQPVKRGKWKHDESGLYCPYCKYIPQWDDDKFCARCGAKMDGGSDADS